MAARPHPFALAACLIFSGFTLVKSDETCRLICPNRLKSVWRCKDSGLCDVLQYSRIVSTVTHLRFDVLRGTIDLKTLPSVRRVTIKHLIYSHTDLCKHIKANSQAILITVLPDEGTVRKSVCETASSQQDSTRQETILPSTQHDSNWQEGTTLLKGDTLTLEKVSTQQDSSRQEATLPSTWHDSNRQEGSTLLKGDALTLTSRHGAQMTTNEATLTDTEVITISISIPSSLLVAVVIILIKFCCCTRRNTSSPVGEEAVPEIEMSSLTPLPALVQSPAPLLGSQSSPAILEISEDTPVAFRTRSCRQHLNF